MALDPLTAIFDLGKTAIEKIWPDPTQRAEEILKLETLKQNGQIAELNSVVQQMMGQLDINKIEASNPNLFVSGWRPSIGWVGMLCLALAFIPKAIVLTIIWTYQSYLVINGQALDVILPQFPDLGVGDVIALLGSMLGVAGLRTYEKKIGVDTKLIGKG
ncbi:MAG: 3TM-type holin [Prolixibacteraceae bacterium]|nr:3TM-type holin [Prolixibacteraceae bacterium]